MEKNKLPLSIIIVNFRSERNLTGCIASLYSRIDFQSKEIIIVNNDKEETLEKVREKFPEVKIIHSSENIGFGRANNIGAKIARGEHLFFLNPDARLFCGNIDEILREFEKDEKVDIVGSRLVTRRGRTQKWSVGVKVDIWDLLLNNLGFFRSKKIWSSLIKKEVFWVAATAFFIRKKAFEEAKGFDENIFMYFEDIDLCKRSRDMGKKILYFPAFSVLHLGGGSYGNNNLQKKHYYDSQSYYFKKHCGKFQYYAVRILRIIFGK
jgi:GT2 family glycosyltransferase